MLRNSIFLFDNHNGPSGVSFRYVICGRKTNYPATDDGNFMLHSATMTSWVTSINAANWPAPAIRSRARYAVSKNAFAGYVTQLPTKA